MTKKDILDNEMNELESFFNEINENNDNKDENNELNEFFEEDDEEKELDNFFDDDEDDEEEEENNKENKNEIYDNEQKDDNSREENFFDNLEEKESEELEDDDNDIEESFFDNLEEEEEEYYEEEDEDNEEDIEYEDWWNYLNKIYSKNNEKEEYENYLNLFDQDDERKNLLKIINECAKEEYKEFNDSAETLKNLSDYYVDDLDKYNLELRKFPMSWYIDFWRLLLKEESDIDLNKIKENLAVVYWLENATRVKSSFFYKWSLYTLFDIFIDEISEWYFLNKIRDMNKIWDKDTVLVWYDLLKNKLLASTIDNLLHYSVFGITWSWKTEYLKTIVTQYLSKRNFDVVFLEKWTDLDFLFEDTKHFIYKNNVITMDEKDILNIFTYLWLEIARRNKEFKKYKVWKIQEYNEKMRDLWKKEMNNLLFVIDEFAKLRETLASYDKKVDESFIRTLSWFIAIFRSFGIYFIAATQGKNVDAVPSAIQNNLTTKVIWYVKWANRIEWIHDLQLKRIAWDWALRKWDFIIQSEKISWTIFRSFYVSKTMYKILIDEWIIIWRNEDDKIKIKELWVEPAANEFLWEKVEELLEELWIDILDTSRLSWYWVNIEKLKELNIWNKIAVIVLFNLIIDWFIDQAERIREKNVAPKKFYVENEVNRLMWKQNSKYKSLWFVMQLVIKFYKDYIEEEFKNIKFPKDIHKAIIDDWESDLSELKEETLREIQNIIEIAFQNTINWLLDE